MTIDANLIEGFKLGVASGVLIGLAIAFLILGMMREKIKSELMEKLRQERLRGME